MKEQLESYFDRLWPICRSLTGDGVRESLDILREIIPLNLHEVPTGTQVHDWVIPKEWNIRDAYIITPDGRKIADFKVNNLHVISYSTPINARMSLAELRPHLHTLEKQPNAIPYMTSYYKETWGFCISHNELLALPDDGEYEVLIDSTLADGHLTYGELLLEGESEREVLFSSYICHPSMANNELSGPLALAFLYQEISKLEKRKYSYRFVLAPETIGIVAFLSKYGTGLLEKLDAGYVMTCCGDSGPLTYKRSRQKTSLADRVAEHILKHEYDHSVINFSVGGSDERQYCAPGYNLPVGSLMRTMYQRFPEYHTSLDNKDFLSFEKLSETVEAYFKMVKLLELNDVYETTVKYCEPQLGKRGLYPSSVNPEDDRRELHNLLHLLAFSDGESDLIAIAEERPCSALEFESAIRKCQDQGLL